MRHTLRTRSPRSSRRRRQQPNPHSKGPPNFQRSGTWPWLMDLLRSGHVLEESHSRCCLRSLVKPRLSARTFGFAAVLLLSSLIATVPSRLALIGVKDEQTIDGAHYKILRIFVIIQLCVVSCLIFAGFDLC
jgi:hypothetical protein